MFNRYDKLIALKDTRWGIQKGEKVIFVGKYNQYVFVERTIPLDRIYMASRESMQGADKGYKAKGGNGYNYFIEEEMANFKKLDTFIW